MVKMKILLIGEYSGLHYNLAQGLRTLGHQVTLASDGDGWKNFPRDIDLLWRRKGRKRDIILKLSKALPQFRGYDVVQLINPIFLDLKAIHNLRIFRYLQKHNRAVFLGANGDDYVYINHAVNKGFSTSVFNVEKITKTAGIQAHIATKLSSDYRRLNEEIASSCKGISACCTEYHMAYAEEYAHKLRFIPLPIVSKDYPFINSLTTQGPLKFFLGIQEKRQVIKGMDVIYEALQELRKRYPHDVDLQIAKNVPFDQYQSMMDASHILCDQLYSYGCGMNGAMAMTKGLIVAGGGEEEMYASFGEAEKRPIINLPDSKEGILKTLELLLEKRAQLPQMAQESRDFALQYHDYLKVAQRYLDFWQAQDLA